MSSRVSDEEPTVLRRCPECREVFAVPRSSARVYCGALCKNRAYEARHPERALRDKRPSARESVAPSDPESVARCRRCSKPVSRRATYCSSTCRSAVSRDRQAADWIPAPGANRDSDALQRRKLIRSWADAGYGSRQMAEYLGMDARAVRKIAAECEIDVPADAVIGKSRLHNAAHILQETAQTLEGLAMGVQLADLATLDPAEAEAWATSMSDSLRTLTRFASKIKEMTQ